MEIDARLTQGGIILGELSLCKVILKDNALFPWVVLVPLRPEKVELIDLTKDDRHLLMDEIVHVSKAMRLVYMPDKMNVASFGNEVPQLHVHIIARYQQDRAWPKPIWSIEAEAVPYTDTEKQSRLVSLRDAIGLRT